MICKKKWLIASVCVHGLSSSPSYSVAYICSCFFVSPVIEVSPSVFSGLFLSDFSTNVSSKSSIFSSFVWKVGVVGVGVVVVVGRGVDSFVS